MKNLAVLLLILSFFGIVLADIPAPPVAQEIRIESDQRYPDYQFYLCSYKITVKPNPNPPHPSRPEMIVSMPESFEQNQIELPFTQQITSHIRYRGDKLSEKVFWLVAVKKSQAQDLESKIRGAVLGSSLIDGIKLERLEDSLELRGKGNQGAKVVLNKISLDEKEMKVKVEEGTSNIGNSINCIGLGFLLTGIVLISGWWTKKKFI